MQLLASLDIYNVCDPKSIDIFWRGTLKEGFPSVGTSRHVDLCVAQQVGKLREKVQDKTFIVLQVQEGFAVPKNMRDILKCHLFRNAFQRHGNRSNDYPSLVALLGLAILAKVENTNGKVVLRVCKVNVLEHVIRKIRPIDVLGPLGILDEELQLGRGFRRLGSIPVGHVEDLVQEKIRFEVSLDGLDQGGSTQEKATIHCQEADIK